MERDARQQGPRQPAKGDFAPRTDGRLAQPGPRPGGATNGRDKATTLELLNALPPTSLMPALFLGHGSPMNAIDENPFTRSLTALGRDLPRPSAVLVVSAHWLTPGDVRVLCIDRPRAIHDFYGFPRPLYEVRYPAPGAPGEARATAALAGAGCDGEWGLDHASWAVLRHVYPEADVPVYEMSLDVAASPAYHVELARRLAPLRERGVLILGSGNVVHNLYLLDWSGSGKPYDWALEFDAWVAERVLAGDVDGLAAYESLGEVAALAAPTNDHYLPLLYAMALRKPDEDVSFTFEGIDLGSVSMRCVRVG